MSKAINWSYAACLGINDEMRGRRAGDTLTSDYGSDSQAIITGDVLYQTGTVEAETREEALEIVSERHPHAVLFSIIPARGH